MLPQTHNLSQLLFLKDYQQLERALQRGASGQTGNDFLLFSTSSIKLQIFKNIKNKNQSVKDHSRLIQLLEKWKDQLSTVKCHPFIVQIHSLALESFVLECNIEVEQEDQQKSFLTRLVRIESLKKMYQHQEIKELLENNLYFLVTCLQLYTKRTIIDKKNQVLEEIDFLIELVTSTTRKFPITINLCKKLFIILIHMKIHVLSTQDQSNNCFQVKWLIENACQKLTAKDHLLNNDTIVVMLYNAIKILLGLDEIPRQLQGILNRLYQIFALKDPQHQYYKHILQIFFIIKFTIFREGILSSKNVENRQRNEKIQKSQLGEKFSVFLNINLDETVVELAQITRNIIRHKVASLSTLIGLKLGIPRFSKDFLQIMHDSPFNNDIQTIKLCFQLFQFRQFQKLQYLLQTVLSVPSTKNLKQRQSLVAMCSIFTGLYLQNREEGLLYTKLNHESHLSCLREGKERRQILKEETLLQHVGFAYYNLAKHEPYLEKRMIFLMKALENLKKSHQLNSENYLLNYCLGKIYLQIHDYGNAYKYSIESCKSHRGSWAPFCLLACVYMCERKILKSLKLIEELMKKYNDVAILYYFRAYIEVNKLLVEVETDEEIQSTKLLGEEYYVTHFQKTLKNKSKYISEIMSYCRAYFQLSMNAENREDENFFSQVGNFAPTIQKGQNYLFPLFRLFLDMDQVGVVESLLKIIPFTSVKAYYYKALVHEKKKQTQQAIIELNNGLQIDPFHPDTLIKLAILEGNNTKNINQALYYLQLAAKFVENSQYALAKGILLSKVGKTQEANEMLLLDLDTAWCQDLPNLWYYY